MRVYLNIPANNSGTCPTFLANINLNQFSQIQKGKLSVKILADLFQVFFYNFNCCFTANKAWEQVMFDGAGKQVKSTSNYR